MSVLKGARISRFYVVAFDVSVGVGQGLGYNERFRTVHVGFFRLHGGKNEGIYNCVGSGRRNISGNVPLRKWPPEFNLTDVNNYVKKQITINRPFDYYGSIERRGMFTCILGSIETAEIVRR